MSDSTPSQTIPNNGLVQSGGLRRKLNAAVSGLAIALGTIVTVDGASGDFDWSQWTSPAAAGLLYLAAAFNIVISLPNTPRSR